MENSLILIGYLIYLPLAFSLTFFVSKALFKNGKVFMLEIFNGREELALSTNNLFKVGFYLLNLGYALLILKISYYQAERMNVQDLVEILSRKIGGFSIYLGIILFLNLFLFLKGRKKSSVKSTLKN